MLDADLEGGLLDLPQPGRTEQLREAARMRTGTPRLILDLGIERACRLPEGAEWAPATTVIPDARRHHTTRPSDTRHLAEPSHGIRHEVNNELCQGPVERPVREWQPLGRCESHVDAGVALASRRDEGLRGVDCRNEPCSQSPDELGGESARAAADIEHALRAVTVPKSASCGASSSE